MSPAAYCIMKPFWSAVCAMVFAGIFSSCSSSGSNGELEIDLLPVKLSEDGNWSMVDRDGNIVYDGEFKNEPSLAVDGIFSVKEGDLYTLYKTGDKNPVALDGCEGLKDVGYVSDGVIPVVFPHERIQLRDKNGKKICELGPVDGKEVVCCDLGFTEGLLAFCVLDENADYIWGFMDRNGKVVIKPKYQYVHGFEDGVALCTKNKKDSSNETSFVVIDHDGKVLFEIDDDLRPLEGFGFQNGRMLLVGSDVNYLVDKKGKKTKLPSKISGVGDFNGEYMIFRSEDGEYGVADINGEICIRPKYRSIEFGMGNKFLASKSGKDETLVLDVKGEVVKELDYTAVSGIYNFGYEAMEGKRYVLLDEDLKQKGTEDFYEIGGKYFGLYVRSDYFEPEDVVNRIMNNLRADGFGKYSYGESAAKIFVGQDASGYIYSPAILDFAIKGFRYTIQCGGVFTESLTTWRDGGYVWKDDSKLDVVRLVVDVPEDAKKMTVEQLRKALEAQGYDEDISDEVEDGSMGNVWFKGAAKSKSGQLYNIDVIVVYEEDSPIVIDLRGRKSIVENAVEDTVVADSIAE